MPEKNCPGKKKKTGKIQVSTIQPSCDFFKKGRGRLYSHICSYIHETAPDGTTAVVENWGQALVIAYLYNFLPEPCKGITAEKKNLVFFKSLCSL